MLRGDLNYAYILHRHLYFLAACLFFDSGIDLEIALKLRLFGGLSGINNSRLDSLLKNRNISSLHAALHDASRFVKDCKDKGPGYVYVFHYFPLNNCLLGHLTGLLFTLFVYIFHPRIFRDLRR